jgi:hypothetical protein
MKNLSLSEKLAIAWITFLNENNIEITDEVSNLFKHKFFEVQKSFLFSDDVTLIDEDALRELSEEINAKIYKKH